MTTPFDIKGAPKEADRQDLADPFSGLFQPEREPAEWTIVFGLFVLATGYSLIFPRFGLVPDEGTILQGAQRVLEGQVPYRDFFCLFTPGSLYFHAFLFKTFGDTISVARAASSVYAGGFAALTYLLARRVCPGWIASLVPILFLAAIFPPSLFALHNWDSTVWAYLSIYSAVRFLERPHWSWALAMGTFCSITALFEQSKGAGLLLGLAVAFGILAGNRRIALRLAHGAGVAIGLAWPVAITVSYFAAKRALPQMLRDLLHPLYHYAAVNTFRYGYMYWGESVRSAVAGSSWSTLALTFYVSSPYLLVSALPIIGVAILIHSSIRARGSHPHKVDRLSYYLLTAASTSGLLVSVLATRKDVFHLVYIAPATSLILAWLLEAGRTRFRLLDPVKPWIFSVLILAFALLALNLLLSANQLVARKTRRGTVNVPAQENVLNYLDTHTTPGEKIFVYPYFASYYYLTQTENPTAYEFMQPGYNTAEEFRRTRDVIAAAQPRVVLCQPSFYEDVGVNFPSTPLQALAARDPLSEFILKEYKPCAVLISGNTGNFVFMVRKDSPCPEGAPKGSEASPAGSEVKTSPTGGRVTHP